MGTEKIDNRRRNEIGNSSAQQPGESVQEAVRQILGYAQINELVEQAGGHVIGTLKK